MQLIRSSHSLAESDAVWRAGRPPSNLLTGQSFTMCDMDWVLPQMHSGLSVWWRLVAHCIHQLQTHLLVTWLLLQFSHGFHWLDTVLLI